ncbi:hypothetical protein CHS0354_002946 [Potamilus streckersoni]|uniref:Uncharacterized protein n=1 Tax=Potamilus streckersoni TaxID=2493646 RepID=A0AAE0RSF3_9BIVA|nr:hypothetical protein CHS0354_002946 [Potamilus streckersoni]
MPSRVQLNATATFDAKAVDWTSTEKPQSVCIVDKRIIAISTEKYWGSTGGIVFVSVTNSISRIRKIDVGKDCFGIATQNLMVCAGGDSILTYDASYEVSKRIPLFDSYVSRSISVSPDGQMIHFTVKDQIVTRDMNNKKLETFKSDVLKGVVAITVDKNGILYCCGQQSNNVVLFSPEGRQLCVLLSHEHGLKNPTGICLNDRNTKLLVFQRKSSEIKVFTLV